MYKNKKTPKSHDFGVFGILWAMKIYYRTLDAYFDIF